MNFKSLQTSFQHEIINEWKNIGGGLNGIQQYAKEDFLEDVKRDCVGILLRLQKECSIFNNDSVEPMRQQVRKYENVLQNSYAYKLNQIIRNNNLLPSIESIINYYKDRPELTQYTLTKEIHRIKNYTIYTHHDNKNERNFRKITDLSEIQAYHTKNFKEVKNVDDDLLWRCSNQSLLADILTALTTIGFVRPEMGAGTTMEELSFVLDFRDGSVRGKCFINVSMASISRPLVGMFLDIYFCPARQIFEAQIESIISYDALTEEEINQAAIFLSTSCNATNSIVASNNIRNKSVLASFSLQSLKVPSFKRALQEIPHLWQEDDQFVIKLRILGDSRQLRRVRLSRLKVNGKISFSALVDITILCAFQNKPLAFGKYCDLLFTYHDIDNECVNIASSEELVDAIEQFTRNGSFNIDVKLESIDLVCHNLESNPPFEEKEVAKNIDRKSEIENTEEKEVENNTDTKSCTDIIEREEEIISNIDQSGKLDSEDGCIEEENNYFSVPDIVEIILEGDNDDTCVDKEENTDDASVSNGSQDSWENIVAEEHTIIAHATRMLGSALFESDLLHSEKLSSMNDSIKSLSSILSSASTVKALTDS
eukprot:CAMPEP_0194137752 /NCGR_PEP_ID=MMETSP0152-20130528/7595_1 /TAXON_ID=1049557 /ORGANISM="Thalassiothrix antarctica, Strain L6-D1" /LENGTH=596 /DNA_ID=CAMNT_0038834895 /DNA_START=93 /DNA_END=1883 /DNA_ORIENTATION=+